MYVNCLVERPSDPMVQALQKNTAYEKNIRTRFSGGKKKTVRHDVYNAQDVKHILSVLVRAFLFVR